MSTNEETDEAATRVAKLGTPVANSAEIGLSGDVGNNLTERQVPSWAVTKLRPPELRDGIIARSRLSQMLDHAVCSNEPLVLLSAPAGSGKSTAIASWSAARPELQTVWMQVDQADNDPVRFWTALVSGLGAIDQTIRDDVEPVLKSPKVSFVNNVLAALVNALDRAGDVVLVLDDYHLIDSEQLHEELVALIDAAPSHLTIVVSTRHDPPLRLGRLRVRGQLCEIRAADLRFDIAEAATILDSAVLTEAEIATLCDRTEGWAAGLILASISLARSPDPAAFVANFAGDNRMVGDYLSTELWDSLETGVQRFFLEISVLDRMCGPLVDHLLDIDGKGSGWLETASRDNQLIISLDDHGGWYRFHHLLQDQLQSRLNRDDHDRWAALHRKAASWFAAHDDPDAAIRHSLTGQDLALAARLVASHGAATFSEGHLVTVQGWLDALGPNTVAGDPSLAVLRVWTVIIDGDWDNIDEPIRVAQARFSQGDLGTDAALLRGSLAAAHSRAAIAKGEIDLALSLSQASVAKPTEHELTCLVIGILGMCLTWRGRHEEAITSLEAALAQARLEDEHLVVSTSLIFLAINACAQNSHGQARHLAQLAIDHAEEHQLSDYHQLALAHSVLGRTVSAYDAGAAARSGAHGVELARRSSEPVNIAFALISLAEIEITLGTPDTAVKHLIEARQLLDRYEDPGTVVTFLARTETRLGTDAAAPIGVRIGINPADSLTARELTVLRLLPSRLSIREVASELYVSHNTAKGHLKAIYRKLHVHDRQTAVQRARELHLL